MEQGNKSFFTKVADIAVKIIPILIIVFVALAVTSLFYYFLLGVTSGSLKGMIIEFASGISACALKVFMAAVLAGIYKLITK